jgi:hypothetical protein
MSSRHKPLQFTGGITVAEIKYNRLIFLGLIVICFSGTTSVFAAGAIPITVKCVRKVEKIDQIAFVEKIGRYTGFSQASCNYKETKGTGLFDGVKSTVRGIDSFNGTNGDIQGFTIAEKGGDSYRAEWDGHCFSLADGDGKPLNRCFGSWRFIQGSGTGRFANVRGGGYFQTMSLTQDSFEVEATGFYEQ